MNEINPIIDLANVIELAVAPVFLLTGIAGFLNVLSGRLGRLVDRAREIEAQQLEKGIDTHIAPPELFVIWRRVHLIHWGIGLCTASGLTVCILIVSLFVQDLWKINLNVVVAGLFILSLLLLITALLLFLREVQLSTQTIRIDKRFVKK